jgi:branched-chain amino acid transport system substrate-binding protein
LSAASIVATRSILRPAHGQSSKVIKIGAFAPQTGPNAITYAVVQGSAALIKTVNDGGGINGYTFDYIILDDQFNPALTVSAARRLVEQEEVLTLVSPIGTPGVAAVKSYLANHKVACVGAGVADAVAGPYVYLVSPSYSTEGAFEARYACDHLVKNGKLGALYQNDEIGKAFLKGVNYTLSLTKDIELVAVPFQNGTLDFTPALALMQRSGTETVISSTFPGNFPPVIKAAESLSCRPTWVTNAFNANPDILRQLPAEQVKNIYFLSYTSLPGTPDVAELDRAFAKYYPALPTSSLSIVGWSAASIFVEAFRRITEGGKEPTRDSLSEALNGLKGFSNNFIRNITYVPGADIEKPTIPRPLEAFAKFTDDKLSFVTPFTETSKVPGELGQ